MAIYAADEWRPLLIILQIIANQVGVKEDVNYQCWFYAIWMNIHYIAANILGMNLNMSVSFFFTDYVIIRFPSDW